MRLKSSNVFSAPSRVIVRRGTDWCVAGSNAGDGIRRLAAAGSSPKGAPSRLPLRGPTHTPPSPTPLQSQRMWATPPASAGGSGRKGSTRLENDIVL